MSLESLSRCGAVLLLVLVSGCSTADLGASEGGGDRRNECRWSRSSCMYEGAYEAGEQEYAEQEAARLNRAESRRLRRGFGW